MRSIQKDLMVFPADMNRNGIMGNAEKMIGNALASLGGVSVFVLACA
jgi:hypothetical protein